MCGIYLYYGNTYSINDLKKSIDKIKGRGPEKTKYLSVPNLCEIGFHRLCIMDVSDVGDQPMYHPIDKNLIVICNGEIYNFKSLKKRYGFDKYTSGSDCEIILWMYQKFGIERTISELDGVFAFAIIDLNKNMIHMGRDPFGVRPLFVGEKKIITNGIEKKELFFASEMKSISDISDKIIPFPPGCWWSSDNIGSEKMEINETWYVNRYYKYDYKITEFPYEEEDILANIKKHLLRSVEKRLQSDRKIGCLLSGGVDSSLIAALVAQHFPRGGIETFSIGLKGAVDLDYADMVAKHIGSKHHRIEITEEDMIKAIPEVIEQIESMDTTTVRASVPNYLISKYISENTDCKVIYQGDGMDEVAGSYLYLANAPDEKAFHDESTRLLKDIHMYDVLRADRTISCWGLEPRTPFLDKRFVNYYMSISPHIRMHKENIEKYLLRKSFDDMNILPKEVLWRRKEAFSDGCSGVNKSWATIVQEYVDTIITDEDFSKSNDLYTHNIPMLKESMFYRTLFDKYYKNHSNVIPYFWLPKWTKDKNVIDPSARILTDVYNRDSVEKSELVERKELS